MKYLDLLRDFGPLIGVILFFIWRDWQREENLSSRVEKLEKYQQEVLTDLSKQCIEVIAANTYQLKWMSNIITSCQAGKKNDQT